MSRALLTVDVFVRGWTHRYGWPDRVNTRVRWGRVRAQGHWLAHARGQRLVLQRPGGARAVVILSRYGDGHDIVRALSEVYFVVLRARGALEGRCR